MRKILCKVRRALTEFDLIDDGDKVCVGVSGGKDSTLLALVLSEISKHHHKKFTVKAITLDCTNGQTDYTPIADFFKSHGIEYEVIKTNIFEVVFDIRKEKSPCSLCAKLRRGQLNTAAKKSGCSKVALGHHADDLIETFFLSMFYEGRLSTFKPKTYMSRMNITQIRPLLFLTEKEVQNAVEKFKIPIIKNICKVNNNTKREMIKKLLSNLTKDVIDIKEQIFNAVISKERYNLFDSDD